MQSRYTRVQFSCSRSVANTVQTQSHCDRRRFRGKYKAHGLGSQLIDVKKLHLTYRDHLVITL